MGMLAKDNACLAMKAPIPRKNTSIVKHIPGHEVTRHSCTTRLYLLLRNRNTLPQMFDIIHLPEPQGCFTPLEIAKILSGACLRLGQNYSKKVIQQPENSRVLGDFGLNPKISFRASGPK